MPRLSIIIPWWDENPALEDTLVSVLQNRPDDCEILVVHTHDYDDPWQLAGEVAFHHLPAESEVVLINHGIRQCVAETVHILRCGLEVQEGWSELPLQRLADSPGLGSVVPPILQRAAPDLAAAAGVGFGFGGTRRVRGVGRAASDLQNDVRGLLGPTLSAGFYRRSDLIEIGGFDPTVGAQMADLDLALALSSLGRGSILESASRIVGEVAELSAIGFRVGRLSERFFWRHASSQTSPSVLSHLAAVMFTYATRPSLRVLADFGGRVLGFLERRNYLERPLSATDAPIISMAVDTPHDESRGVSSRRAA